MLASPDEVLQALEDTLRVFKEVPNPDRWKLLSNHCINLIHYRVADQRTVIDALTQMVVTRDAVSN